MPRFDAVRDSVGSSCPWCVPSVLAGTGTRIVAVCYQSDQVDVGALVGVMVWKHTTRCRRAAGNADICCAGDMNVYFTDDAPEETPMPLS